MITKKFDKLVLSISNKGIPCLWENGGKITDDFGQSFIIADKQSKPKKPLYIRTDPKPNSGHALIPVRLHDIIIVCKVRDEVSTIQIYSISKIDLEEKLAYVDMINSFENGEWAAVSNPIYDTAIVAATLKAKTVNCIDVVYVLDKDFRKDYVKSNDSQYKKEEVKIDILESNEEVKIKSEEAVGKIGDHEPQIAV